MNKTYEYFKKREREHQKKQLKRDKKFNEIITKEYKKTYKEIQNRMDWWIGKYADDNEITIDFAKEIISKTDINDYKELAKEYVKNKDLSPRANKEMRIYNLKMKMARDELLQKYIDLELGKLGTKAESIIEEHIYEEVEEELIRQAGILGKDLIDKDRIGKVSKYLTTQSHNTAHFSEYLWTDIKELRNNLENGLNRTLLRGEHPMAWKNELKRYYDKRFGSAEYAARRLAMTETAIAQNNIAIDTIEENGYEEVIVITELNACELCKPHDGSIVKIDKAKPGENVPIWHPNCRCTVAAYYDYADVVDLEEYTVNGKTYKVDGKHVVLDYSAHEKDVAKILANEFDVTVKMVPRVLHPQRISTPDYLIRNEKWDLKTVNSRGDKAFYNALRKSKKQANNFILELNGNYNNKWLDKQFDTIFKSRHYKNVDKIMILENMKIKKIKTR